MINGADSFRAHPFPRPGLREKTREKTFPRIQMFSVKSTLTRANLVPIGLTSPLLELNFYLFSATQQSVSVTVFCKRRYTNKIDLI